MIFTFNAKLPLPPVTLVLRIKKLQTQLSIHKTRFHYHSFPEYQTTTGPRTIVSSNGT